MSPVWPHLALGTFGAGCAVGGLILWLFPFRGGARLAAIVAGGVGLTGFLAATGLDSVEDRVMRWIDAAASGGIHEGLLWLLPVILIKLALMYAFAAGLGASYLWLGEAFESKNRETRLVLFCASIGAFGWAMTAIHLLGVFDILWKSDLGPSLPPRGMVEAGLMILDMTGLVAGLTLPPRIRSPL